MSTRVGPVRLAACAAACCVAAPTLATDVYILTSGHAATDQRVVNLLAAQGITSAVGVPYYQVNAGTPLAQYRAVYVQASANGSAGSFTPAVQDALVAYVQGGGGLVTAEWTVWKLGTSNPTLSAVLPVVPSGAFTRNTDVRTLTVVTPEATINAGLPDAFTLTPVNLSGTETNLAPKGGASVFYDSSFLTSALVGWRSSPTGGRVACFSLVNYDTELDNPAYARLVANTLRWAGNIGLCRADWNGDAAFGSADITSFLSAWFGDRASSPRATNADYNGSGVTDSADITAFLAGWFNARVTGGC